MKGIFLPKTNHFYVMKMTRKKQNVTSSDFYSKICIWKETRVTSAVERLSSFMTSACTGDVYATCNFYSHYISQLPYISIFHLCPQPNSH